MPSEQQSEGKTSGSTNWDWLDDYPFLPDLVVTDRPIVTSPILGPDGNPVQTYRKAQRFIGFMELKERSSGD